MTRHESAWKLAALGEIASVASGGTPSRTRSEYWQGGTIPWVTTAEVNGGVIVSTEQRITDAGQRNSSARLFPVGTVLVAMYGQGKTRGQVAMLGVEATTNQACAALLVSEDVDPWFVFQYLAHSYDSLRAMSNSGGQHNLSAGLISQFRIPVPPLPEQRKIAEILRTWDDAIDRVTQLAAAARTRYSAASTIIFEETHQDTNSLMRARDIFEPVSEKARPDLPLLAVTQDAGIVRRDALERRVVMPEGAVSGYKVVRPGDFVISLRSFEGGLERSNELGLISPAYTVLRAHREVNAGFYARYFKSQSFIARLDEIVFGIRDGKQIAFRDFGAMQIPAPAEEQARKAAVLDEVGREIELLAGEIAALRTQKRGLMQKLLSGEIRVDV